MDPETPQEAALIKTTSSSSYTTKQYKLTWRVNWYSQLKLQRQDDIRMVATTKRTLGACDNLFTEAIMWDGTAIIRFTLVS
jgi:hypothetical protein